MYAITIITGNSTPALVHLRHTIHSPNQRFSKYEDCFEINLQQKINVYKDNCYALDH